MKTHHSTSSQPIVRINRSAVTLTEVLMSLMIMSIGVGLVATLFPIAALRSAQATKMTNAAITKLNVEALLDARPEIIFDPDGDFANSTSTAVARWNRLTEHFRTNAEKNYIVDPSGYFASAASTNNFGPVSQNAGLIDAVPAASRGWSDYFGNISGTTPYTVLPRFDGGIRSQSLPAQMGPATAFRNFELLAAELTSLGDGWDTLVDAVPEGFLDSSGNIVAAATSNTVGVVFSDEISLDGIVTSRDYSTVLSIADPELVRITIFRGAPASGSSSPYANIEDGSISQSFPLTAVDGTTCVWTEVAVGALGQADYNQDGLYSRRSLPLEFLDTQPGRVLIQQKRVQDFNWLLTVRRGPDGRARGVDVVVMFNNGRSPDNERVYPANFFSGAFGAAVAKTSGVDANGDPAEPFIKRGSWVLDVQNARWYRIAGSKDHPANPDWWLLTLESAAVQSTPGVGAGATLAGGAIFIPGIVDVYPLGSKALPDHMKQLNF